MHGKGSMVTAFKPGAGLRRGRELVFDETDYRDTVRMQAQDARETARALRSDVLESRRRAQQAIADARALSYVCALPAGTFVGRCAWCERYRVGDEWLAVTRSQAFGRAEVTHSICEDCIAGLRETGVSS